MEAGGQDRGRDGPRFSLIIPAYNPGSLVKSTWAAVESFLRQTAESWEVLFVCDGCLDDSAIQLANLAATLPAQVRILSYMPNRGKGYAVRRGLELARGEYRIFTDFDLAYSFEEIGRVAERLREGAPVVIASRTHPNSTLQLPTRLQGYAYRRHLQSTAFSWIVKSLLPLTNTDTQAGLKGLCARVARLVVPRLTCDGFGFDCELLTACKRMQIPVEEVPVCVRFEDRASTTNFAAMGRMLRDLWRIRGKWRYAEGDGSALPNEPASRRAA